MARNIRGWRTAKGVVLYRGPSALDGAPVVAICTFHTTNRKTGPMAQIWVLREDMHPSDANGSGADASICGVCPHRGRMEGGRNVGRTCYVDGRAPSSVWSAYRRGVYVEISPDEIPVVMGGRGVRLGAYGDVAALPHAIVAAVAHAAMFTTGYTHQWREGFALADYVMASCETDADVRDATALGYRVFRVTAAGAGRQPTAPDGARFMECPAETRGLQCASCRACDGASGHRTAHVQIQIHGSPAAAAARSGRLPVLQ